jgi:beta-N-acetylhexosaminidase
VFSPTVMTMLRANMHFAGVIVSDDIGAAQAVAHMPPGERAIDFLTAGGDMIISKFVGPAVAMASAVLSRVATDPSFRARVQNAVQRVLQAKSSARLLPCPNG